VIGPAFLAAARAAWRATRRAVLWWSIALVGSVVVTVALWPAFRGASGISQAIDALPTPIIDALGLADFGSPAGFLRGNLYELLVPLLLCIAAADLVNGQTAGDESGGRLELFLAQPVERRTLFVARLLVCFLGIGIIVAVTVAAQLVSNSVFSLSIDMGHVVGTVIVCGLLAILFGSVAYLVACLRASPPLVLGASLGLAVAGYIVAALFPVSDALRPWRVISPWQWANGGDPLVNGLDLWRPALLVLVSVLLAIGGTIAIDRRDVAAG
jgi:ABC-2 type transport system permease protein